eukprot:s3354_g9.t1
MRKVDNADCPLKAPRGRIQRLSSSSKRTLEAAPTRAPIRVRSDHDPNDDPCNAQENLHLPVEPKVQRPPKPASTVARIAEEPEIMELSANSGGSTGNSHNSAETAAMTDASKRRMDAAVGKADVIDEWEEFPVVAEDSRPWYSNYGAPIHFQVGLRSACRPDCGEPDSKACMGSFYGTVERSTGIASRG